MRCWFGGFSAHVSISFPRQTHPARCLRNPCHTHIHKCPCANVAPAHARRTTLVNELGPEAGTALAKAVEVNSSLTKLNLGSKWAFATRGRIRAQLAPSQAARSCWVGSWMVVCDGDMLVRCWCWCACMGVGGWIGGGCSAKRRCFFHPPARRPPNPCHQPCAETHTDTRM